jgi:hypothetical protein
VHGATRRRRQEQITRRHRRDKRQAWRTSDHSCTPAACSTSAPTLSWIAASSVGKFFEVRNSISILRIMAWAGRELAKAHRPQFSPKCLPAHRQSEFVPQPLNKIGKPPGHHAVEIRLWPGLNARARAKRCVLLSRRVLPGAVRSHRPPGPCSLKRTTQSRTIWRPTPPTLAAMIRLAPS